jgi:predicted Zn-dependent peptidase
LLVFIATSAEAQDGVRLPPYSKFRLANGMTVLMMEQHEVPIISMQFIIKDAGSSADLNRTAGLASITADLLRKGTRTRTAQQLSNELDRLGGELNFTTSLDYTGVSAEFLAKDIGAGLDLVADVLRNPVFPEDEIGKLTRQRIDEIKSAKDRADRVIGRYFYSYLYRDDPYSRPVDGDDTTLPRITRDDVQKFYNDGYRPSGVILAVAGDFQTEALRGLIEQRFGSWSSSVGGIARDVFRLVGATPPARRALLVDKPDSTQTYFNIGYLGISRTSPDRVGLAVVNTLFGGRFTSRLNTALRINSGLTYGARSSFEQLLRTGPFVISSYTRNATTEKALDMTLEVLAEFRKNGVTQAELDSAKAYLKGQFPLSIETTDRLASTIAQLEFYGLDQTDINSYPSKIDALTLDETRRLIDQYFLLDKLVFVFIGKASEIQNVVKKYAPAVETKEITAPGF